MYDGTRGRSQKKHNNKTKQNEIQIQQIEADK